MFNTILSVENLDWFRYPHSSGLLLFLVGGWAIFAIFHIFLYLRNHNTLYLLYGFYLLAIVGYQVHFLHPQYVYLDNPLELLIGRHPEFFAESSYLIYYLFAFKFLNIKTEFPKWYKHITRALILIGIFCIISFIISLFDNNKTIQTALYHFFIIYILILSVITYVMFFKSKNPFRWYIIVGSLLLTIFSVLALIISMVDIQAGTNYEKGYVWLYIGYLLETLLFALGLGHLQYHNEREKNRAKESLIIQLKENERLQKEVEETLRKNVSSLTKQAKKDQVENLKMKYEKQLAELKVSILRNQMNPHFIFNSLNSIKRFIIDNEQENAVYYLNKFSKLIRKILSASMEKEIPLAEELETAKMYVTIENIRFNEEINYFEEIEKDLNTETIKMPSLLLQPFLENAIWHGLSAKTENKQIILKVYRLGKTHLVIEITDNGIGRQKAAEIKSKKLHQRKSVGILLTEERLKSFSEKFLYSYEIEFEDLKDINNIPRGTKVKIMIPLN